MAKVEQSMSIGTLSKMSGVGIETIRYYERRGLLRPVARKSSGYRVFNNESYNILRFLKYAQELGFSLSEIKNLLRLRGAKGSSCEEVQVRASTHLRHVEEKIEKLVRIRDVLSRLILQCRSRKVTDNCPILDCLEERSEHEDRSNSR